jgi:hypothetical protein
LLRLIRITAVTREKTMSELVRRKVEIVVNAGYVLPTMLAMNTLLLFAYDGLLGIPGWVKVAATLFLQF